MKAFIVVFALAAAAASAKDHAHHTPYAGEQLREIKSLSELEVHELRQGQGMGLAKAAELNGYPGPAHVLELAQPLALQPAQRQATQQLLDRHKAEARRLGAQLVEAERRLDQAFAQRQVDAAQVETLTAEIGRLQGRLRASHLSAHLEQTALLTEEQVRRYAQLRGYGNTGVNSQ